MVVETMFPQVVVGLGGENTAVRLPGVGREEALDVQIGGEALQASSSSPTGRSPRTRSARTKSAG
jgi:hypothetical protein